jgi:PKD repeat protein
MLLVLLAGLIVVGTVSAGTPTYAWSRTWGGATGSDPGQFSQVFGITVGGDGSVYVADSCNYRIQKYDGMGWSVVGFPSNPYGIAMDSAGNLLVVDSASENVLRYNGGPWAYYAGPFNVPHGIAVDRYDRLYVAEYASGTVYRCDGGGRTALITGLIKPSYVALDGAGNIYVTAGTSVLKFDFSGNPAPGWSPDVSGGYQGVAVDALGRVVLAEHASNRVRVVDNQTGATLAMFGSFGGGDGHFNSLLDLAVDGSGNVYTSDYAGGVTCRVQKFLTSPVADFTANVTSGYTPLPVQFTDRTYGDTASRSWDFGDGNTSTAANPIHTYRTAGTYTVNLTVSNEAGSDSKTMDITVQLGPSLEVVKQVSVDGGTTWLDADTPPGPYLLQSGPSPMFLFKIVNHGATLRDVVVTDSVFGSIGTILNLPTGGIVIWSSRTGTWTAGQHSNTATASGTFGGQTVTDTDDAYYFGAEPGVTIKVFTNGQDANTAPGPSIAVGDPVTWTYNVTNTGNCALTSVAVVDDRGVPVTCPKSTLAAGESMMATATGTAVFGQYANNGTVSGTPLVGSAVTATDISHYRGIARPIASFTKNVESGAVPLTVAFTDTSTGTVDSRSWTFGDGGTSAESNPSHTYTSPGTYTVTLRVANPLQNATATGTVTVTARSGFDAYPQYGPAPLNVSFLDYSVHAATWYWTFGDGATSTALSPHHVYTTPGLYTVSLTVTGSDGRTNTVTKDHLVHAIDAVPVTTTTPFPVVPIPGGVGAPMDLDGDGRYEDVNGNGRLDFADVTLYFNQMTWIAANEPLAPFDYNGNGRIDFADVTWLFNLL